jgi:hypothetical protein
LRIEKPKNMNTYIKLPGVSEAASAEAHEIHKLIEKYRNTKIRWIVNGLWRDGGIAVVHALEGQFKSIFVYQLAEAIAKGQPFLRSWDIPAPRRIGIYQSEMSDIDSGERLDRMFPHKSDIPLSLRISDEEFKRTILAKHTLEERFSVLDRWVREKRIEILMMDTINSLLATTGDPNGEFSASKFLDYLGQLPTKANLLVRHDGKPTKETEMRADNQKVRGSNRLVEDASVVIRTSRKGRADHEILISIGKLRNNAMPDDLTVWFDADSCRLTPLDPVMAMLEQGGLSREDLIEQGFRRFRLKRSAVENHIGNMERYLTSRRDGHRRIWEINHSAEPAENGEGEAKLWWLRSVLREYRFGSEVLGDSGVDVEGSTCTGVHDSTSIAEPLF